MQTRSQDNPRVLVQLLPGASLPAAMTTGAACVDLAVHSSMGPGGIIRMDLLPGETARIGTGVMLAIPVGYEGLIRPRSGLAMRGIYAHLGTIDADYRGEIVVLLENRGETTLALSAGMRIAQLAIRPVPTVTWSLAKDLDETERGAGGFGSTGA